MEMKFENLKEGDICIVELKNKKGRVREFKVISKLEGNDKIKFKSSTSGRKFWMDKEYFNNNYEILQIKDVLDVSTTVTSLVKKLKSYDQDFTIKYKKSKNKFEVSIGCYKSEQEDLREALMSVVNDLSADVK